MTITHGSLFTGYDGLGLALKEVFGEVRTLWTSDIDPGACKVIAHRLPGVPNLGDITKIKWTPDCPECGKRLAAYHRDSYLYYCASCHHEWDVSIRLDDPDAHLIPEPADVWTGGSPCQDLSAAGRRAGMTEGTRSNLWVAMREGIAALRPKLVVWENVRGAYSAGADSDLEFCPGCMGDTGDRGPVLRALGRVFGDLLDLGYRVVWRGLPASSVGLCHPRFRVFVVAYAPDLGYQWLRAARGRWSGSAHSAGGPLLPTPRAARGGSSTETVALLPTPTTEPHTGNGHARNLGQEVALLPTPMRGDSEQTGRGPFQSLPLAVNLLPTPSASGFNDDEDVDQWLARRERVKETAKNGNGMGMPLGIAVRMLLTDATGGHERRGGARSGEVLLKGAVKPEMWSIYASAVARQEFILGRLAPAPTKPGKNGQPKLSPELDEWLMGLIAGYLTDVPGITWNEVLRLCGNGVVPRQAAVAIRWCLDQIDALERAA